MSDIASILFILGSSELLWEGRLVEKLDQRKAGSFSERTSITGKRKSQ
jgi:hypothetical protein